MTLTLQSKTQSPIGLRRKAKSLGRAGIKNTALVARRSIPSQTQNNQQTTLTLGVEKVALLVAEEAEEAEAVVVIGVVAEEEEGGRVREVVLKGQASQDA